jgi:DNA polymerase-3 subunit gamma/tau
VRLGYLVLARKWRPQSFEELTGQETIVRILKNAISQNRIAHAYLFSGPRGVGKTTTARILAKALNCEKGPTPSPCDLCINCISVIEGHSVDVIEIDGASNNSVDDIRDLRERVKFAPSTGRYKVYIIDEAHMLSQSAFNALLKTLEEPPPHVIFVLATTAPHKIPVTVHSRCQHLPFKRIPSSTIKDHLKRIASEEKINITEQAIELLVKASDGSMRDALTLLDQVASFSERITEEEIKTLLGITDTEVIITLLEKVFSDDKKGLLEVIEQTHEAGIDFKALILDMIDLTRTMLVIKITGIVNPELSETEREFIKRTLPELTEEELALYLNELIKTESELRSAFSARVAFELGLIRATMLKTLKPVTESLKRLNNFIETTVSEQSEHPESVIREDIKKGEDKKTNSSSESLSQTQTGEIAWDVVISRIEEDSPVLASRIVHAMPVVEGSRLILQFNGGHSIHADAVKKQLKKVSEIVSEVSENKIREVLIETVQTAQTIQTPLLRNTEPLSEEEKMVLETFGGRIIERRKLNV